MSLSAIGESPRLPVPADQLVGRVLRIPGDRCRYRHVALTLFVRRVRLDISQWYDRAWVWLEGDELADAGYSLGRIQALVHVSACNADAAPAGGDAVRQSPALPPAAW